MASAHLSGGRDVILPQYVGRLSEIEAFEAIAHRRGAEFREIVLLADREASIGRFLVREDDSEWAAHSRREVALGGGPAMLAAMYDRLLDVVGSRPSAVLIHSETGAVDETYAALLQAVAGCGSGSPSGAPGSDVVRHRSGSADQRSLSLPKGTRVRFGKWLRQAQPSLRRVDQRLLGGTTIPGGADLVRVLAAGFGSGPQPRPAGSRPARRPTRSGPDHPR
jgi:hypothetical protein